MKKIEYKEPVGTLRELEGMQLKKIKEAFEDRNILGILFEDCPAYSAAAILQGANEPWFTISMMKFEAGKVYVSLYDEKYEEAYVDTAVCFTKEEYEKGILQDLDEQNQTNWAKYYADERTWKEVEDMFDYEEECCGARAFVLDGIYECVCKAINECTDEE